jgi:hypothetical protein
MAMDLKKQHSQRKQDSTDATVAHELGCTCATSLQ